MILKTIIEWLFAVFFIFWLAVIAFGPYITGMTDKREKDARPE